MCVTRSKRARIENDEPVARLRLRNAASRVQANPATMRGAMVALILGALAACASPPAPVSPSQALDGDPGRGLAFAQSTCGSCHALAAGETLSPYPAAPTFEAIANTPGMTRIALGAWMQSSHPSMPQLIVEADTLDDVYAYLSTLKRTN